MLEKICLKQLATRNTYIYVYHVTCGGVTVYIKHEFSSPQLIFFLECIIFPVLTVCSTVIDYNTCGLIITRDRASEYICEYL